jgi:hypothetical protein
MRFTNRYGMVAAVIERLFPSRIFRNPGSYQRYSRDDEKESK